MSNCLVCNTSIDVEFDRGSRAVGVFHGAADGFVCGSSCESRYDKGVRHGSSSSSGIKCTGCNCDISSMSSPVYSGDFDPFCSNSCKSAHDNRVWSDM